MRRIKEGTSAVLLQSGRDENWWADSMECYTYIRTSTVLVHSGLDEKWCADSMECVESGVMFNIS